MPDLRLNEIWIYPIKSLGGIRLKKARVLPKGLELDRRWMLVNENGKFMSQRFIPQLALFRLTIENESLTIEHEKSLATHRIAIGVQQPNPETTSIWDDVVQTHEVRPETSAWFSDQLKLKCKLVFFPEKNSRPVDKDYAVNNEHVSLADGYPFLIIGQASLDDLNSRLKAPITIHRFRPNFVFTGGQPYEEDSWRQFTIGSNQFIGVKNCKRCVLTTVNPDTGETGEEPLRTLSMYRKRDSKVYFGQNAVACQIGHVQLGDKISLMP
jgi:uncharacterized protein YcbX